MRLAMLTCRGDRERFEQTMRAKGIDVLFRRNDDGRIYGVTFIDHNAREVYNGSRLGQEFSANAFERLFTEPAQTRHEEQAQEQGAVGLAELFGVDITPNTEPEPYEDEIQRRKRKKEKRSRSIT